MKRDIQIFDSRGGDRAIGILCENDVIVNVLQLNEVAYSTTKYY